MPTIISARLLAMFEGDKDSRHNVGIAFGPIFEALGEAAADIANLKIVLPVYTTPIVPPAPASPSTDQGNYKFCIGL